MLTKPCWLALQAEALHLADTAAEAFEAMKEGAGKRSRGFFRSGSVRFRGSGLVRPRRSVIPERVRQRRSGPDSADTGDLRSLPNHSPRRDNTQRALRIWRSGGVRFSFQEVDAQSVGCLKMEALLQWHFGEIPSCHATMAEAISLARKLNDMHGLAVTLGYAGRLAYYELGAVEMERLASDLIELSTRYGFALWLAIGKIFRGWARSASDSTEGLSWIEEGIDEVQAAGSISWMSYFLALKAQALYLANRASEALRRRKHSSKVLVDATYLLNSIGFAVYFLRLWVRTIPKLRVRSAKPSKLQMSRSRSR